jgi:hypothetical protein
MHRREGVGLHICLQERDVAEASGLRVFAAIVQKTVAAIDRQHRPGWSHQPRKLHCGIAESATGIDDLIPRLHSQRGKHFGTVQRQSIDKNMTPPHEFGD